ncbi:MAG TPA: hypothetical protein DIW24_02660 [Bacteroidetes bacterium]|nr:hypothetical protein [Bacteroidota bacterium]HRR08941.1 hypothetical protein [Rhodothermales bacterium]
MKKTVWMSWILLAIAACNPQPPKQEPTPEPKADSPIAMNGKRCFLMAAGKDTTSAELTFDNGKVTGNYAWSPFEQHGAYGDITGELKDGWIRGEYAFEIEGSNQVEEVKFKLEGSTLSKVEAELMEKGGKLVLKNPDETKITNEVLTETPCK